MLIITWKIFPCKLRRQSKTIAKYAPSLTVSGNIASEEFQSWVQGLIAARNNKASNNKALSVMEQPTNTPTTMNFPVYPTEAVNMSGRRLSQIFFPTRDMPTGTRPALL
jgi:hypothetical protein